MKNIFGFLVLSFTFLILITSCAKEADSLLETSPDTINAQLNSSKDSVVTDYPSAIDDYVAANHPGASISEVTIDDDGEFEVYLDDMTELHFDIDGNFIEEDEEDDDSEDEDFDEDESVTDYPSAKDDYVAANHPDASIVEVELEDDGSYEVELDDDTEIVFDADGNFVEYDD
ncbi:MAG: PepSY-like domain-containing protein [Saprospiraceae bacterium]|nr:PepSY-like domain-containing protein [Saprospiraceae bacterium]